jgi:large subunit ribosomal protein L23
VNVIKVNTINLHPRFKMVRGRVAKSSGYKKAIVTLKKGQSIDITTGI